MIFKEKDTLFLMIDIQEKFENIIFEMDEVLQNSNILNKSAEILGIPLIITEQYPKGLGSTCDSIYIPENTPIIEKFKFSSYTDEVAEIIKGYQKPNIIIYGVETHVCLTQTALELKANGFNVGIVADAVSSRHVDNKLYALTRLGNLGIQIVTTEMILFELLNNSKHLKFREISKLIK
jgi:isochorismate hydrolase